MHSFRNTLDGVEVFISSEILCLQLCKPGTRLKHCFSNGPIKRNQMPQTMQMSQSRNAAVLGNYMMYQQIPSRV